MEKPKIIILTSRKWNEWIASDTSILELCESVLFTQKDELTLENVIKINPKYIFVPHWSYIIPKEIFNNYETIIFHMTDLPYGRGGSPLQNLILREHSKTKISAIQCTSLLDGGDVYCKEELTLYGSAFEIFLRASKITSQMIVKIIKENIKPSVQVGEVIEFKRRRPEESDMSLFPFDSVEKAYDFIRMLDAPDYPKAFIDLHNFRIEFSDVLMKEEGLKGTFEIIKGNRND